MSNNQPDTVPYAEIPRQLLAAAARRQRPKPVVTLIHYCSSCGRLIQQFEFEDNKIFPYSNLINRWECEECYVARSSGTQHVVDVAEDREPPTPAEALQPVDMLPADKRRSSSRRAAAVSRNLGGAFAAAAILLLIIVFYFIGKKPAKPSEPPDKNTPPVDTVKPLAKIIVPPPPPPELTEEEKAKKEQQEKMQREQGLNIRDELAAAQLDEAKKLSGATGNGAIDYADKLRDIVKRFAGTPAAKEAKALLDGNAPPSSAAAGAAEQLLNGSDVTDWQGDLTAWSANRSPAEGKTIRGKQASNQGKRSLIAFPKTYGDFTLTAKFKVKGNNGGLYIRSSDSGNAARRGYRFGLGGQDYTGMLADMTTVGTLQRPKDAINQSFKSGDWNSLEITCEGARIRIKMNGAEIIDYTEARPDRMPKEGQIALEITEQCQELQFADIVVTPRK